MDGCLYEVKGSVCVLAEGSDEPTEMREWSGLKYIKPGSPQTDFYGWFASALYSPHGETEYTIKLGEGALMQGVSEIRNPGEPVKHQYLSYGFFPLTVGQNKSITFSRHCWETIISHLNPHGGEKLSIAMALESWLADQPSLAPTAPLYDKAYALVTECAVVWIDPKLWEAGDTGMVLTITDEMGNGYAVQALPEGSGWHAIAYRDDGNFSVNNVAHSGYPTGRGPFPTQAEAIGACMANLVNWIAEYWAVETYGAPTGTPESSSNPSYMLVYDPVSTEGNNLVEGEHGIWDENEANEKAQALMDSGTAKMVNIWEIGDTESQDRCIAYVGPDPDKDLPQVGPDGKYEGTDITAGQLVIPRRGS